MLDYCLLSSQGYIPVPKEKPEEPPPNLPGRLGEMTGNTMYPDPDDIYEGQLNTISLVKL